MHLSKKQIGLIIVVILVLGFLGWRQFGSKKAAPQYQTAQAQVGTLVSTVSASGNVITGNNLNITTTGSGIVSSVYVKNGDHVTAGQKIADVTLDQESLQRQAAAWSSYLSAKSSLASAQANLYTLQNTLFTTNQKLINDAVERNLDATDPTYIEENASWKAAEASYLNQQTVISQTQAAVTSSWYAFQQISSTITAPSAGVISGLTIAPGVSLASTASTSSSGNNVAQTVGTIVLPQGHLQASVNLAEIDAAKVSPGQKATLTLDAFPNLTFTGKVLVINTNGTVSSGVTNYPAIIAFDPTDVIIYPNMAVSAKIITSVTDNAILVPSSAVTTTGGQSTVQVMKNNQPSTVNVTIGNSDDTQTAILSGVSSGDTVVTSVINPTTSSSTSTTSIFSSLGRGGFGGGGGGAAIRVGGGAAAGR